MQNAIKNVVININGTLTPLEQAQVSVFDRSYLYGDSLYEVMRTYGGRFFMLDAHLERLEKSAELCHMKFDQSLAEYKSQILRTTAEFRKLPGMQTTEAYCRIIVSRGTGKIGFGLNCLLTPTTYTIIVQPLETPSTAQFEKGFRFQISDRIRNSPRSLDPAMKSGNYLNSLLAYLEATTPEMRKKSGGKRTGAPAEALPEEPYDDALLCDADGFLTEGTTFNIFYVRRGILATPPLDVGILDGITRQWVLDLAKSIGIRTRVLRFPRERLYEADEVFMTSTIKEVFPVTQIDRIKIANGKPGPITRKLAQAFSQSVSQGLT